MAKLNNLPKQVSEKSDCLFIECIDREESLHQQILSNISHELRTPVAILKSNIQLLKTFNFDLDPFQKDKSLMRCEKSVDYLVNFLDNIQLLNVAIKSGLEITNSVIQVIQLTENLPNDMNKLNLDCQLLDIQFHLTDKQIISDLGMLQQIISNLVSNALKFSTDSVRLSITTLKNKLSITVKDHGIGIPYDEKESVFNPFVRANNVRRIAGAGLGLAIVNSITKSFGGEIFLSSEINKGTIVKIILPYELPNKNFDH